MKNRYPDRSIEQPLGAPKGHPIKNKTQPCQETEALAGLPTTVVKENLMCTKTAAQRLSISHQTLEKWRSQNRGPRFCKVGRKAVRYRKSDLDAFIEMGFGEKVSGDRVEWHARKEAE